MHLPSPWLSVWSRHLWRLKLFKDSVFTALFSFHNIGASACPMVVFSGFYESHGPTPSCGAHGIVLAHRHDHQNGQHSAHILHRHFVLCRPGGHRGDTEQIVAWWRHLVAFMKALDFLHWAMHAVLHHHTSMATIKMASDWGTFVCCHRLFCLIKHSLKTMLWSI